MIIIITIIQKSCYKGNNKTLSFPYFYNAHKTHEYFPLFTTTASASTMNCTTCIGNTMPFIAFRPTHACELSVRVLSVHIFNAMLGACCFPNLLPFFTDKLFNWAAFKSCLRIGSYFRDHSILLQTVPECLLWLFFSWLFLLLFKPPHCTSRASHLTMFLFFLADRSITQGGEPDVVEYPHYGLDMCSEMLCCSPWS